MEFKETTGNCKITKLLSLHGRKEKCKEEKTVLIGVCGLNGNFRFLFDNPIIKSSHEQTDNHTFQK